MAFEFSMRPVQGFDIKGELTDDYGQATDLEDFDPADGGDPLCYGIYYTTEDQKEVVWIIDIHTKEVAEKLLKTLQEAAEKDEILNFIY